MSLDYNFYHIKKKKKKEVNEEETDLTKTMSKAFELQNLGGA